MKGHESMLPCDKHRVQAALISDAVHRYFVEASQFVQTGASVPSVLQASN
jgi:hypothetical protein